MIKLRPAKSEDVNFVLSSWLRSYRISPAYKAVPNETYFGNIRPLVSSVLEMSEVTIACSAEDEDQILGFIVARRQFDMPVVSFVYVKHSHRRLRIADTLMRSLLKEGDEVSIATAHLPWLTEAFENRNIVFNPFLDLVHLKEN